MAYSTGIAVGCAVGIPTALAVIVAFAFWYRQKLNYKKAKKLDINDGFDDVTDLDLENIMNSPQRKNSKKGVESNNSTESIYNTNNNESAADLKRPDKTLRNTTYMIRKNSKIMGLKMIPRDIRPSNNLKSDSFTNSKTDPSTQQGERNYMNYYESVIPVIEDNNINNPSIPSLGIDDNSKTNLTQPSTPHKGKHEHQVSINPDFIKLLHQGESPMYPKHISTYSFSKSLQNSPVGSRNASSSNILETPIKNKTRNPINKASKQYEQNEELSLSSSSSLSPPPQQPSLKQRQGSPSLHQAKIDDDKDHLKSSVSPFDTPPSNRYFNVSDHASDFESVNSYSISPTKSSIRKSINTNCVEENGSVNDNVFLASPSKDNLHKRQVSMDKKDLRKSMLLELDDDEAESHYINNRRQWLDNVKNR